MKLAPVISLAEYRTRRLPLAVMLRGELAQLDIVCEALVMAHRHGVWPNVLEEWRHFDTALRAHMCREERELLGGFRDSYPDEADDLVAEHVELAIILDVLAVGMDFQSVPATDLDLLVTTLREHAEREEVMFYPWFDAHVGTQMRG